MNVKNALFLKGLVDAYRVFDKQDYLRLALKTASFVKTHGTYEGRLLHQPTGDNRVIYAFLDDYAFTIEAFIALYEAIFDENWRYDADTLTKEAITLFYDNEEKAFFYTPVDAEILITRKSEIMDNIIPSSLSAIVRGLYRLGEMMDNEQYINIVDEAFTNVFPHIKRYGSAYSNWALQLLEQVYGNNEIVLAGTEALRWRKELDKHYIPNKITIGGTKSSLPLLKDKVGFESKSYLCKNKTCSLPQNTMAELLSLINDNRDSSQIN